ncbi:hypothetical protein ScPMuIL_005594 [Solemya velum]
MADSMSVSTQDRSSSTGKIVGTGLHLDMVPAHQLQIQNKSTGLPELPSHQFEYSRWHDVKDVEITGDQMRAPRVRIAPAQDTKSFQKLKDENEELIHHSLKGRQKTQHRKSLANWEKCECVCEHRDRLSSTGEIVGTGLHLDMVPAHKLKIQNKSSGLPELPSHQFEYSRWHDVKDGEITGDQMRAPRVRIAPAQDTKSFQKLKDENEELIHHSLKGRQKTQHRKSLQTGRSVR